MANRLAKDFIGTISIGTFNNEYRFIDTVGKGGFGEVYKVVSKKDYQTYALKKIRFDQQRRKNKLHLIKRELVYNAKLSHENVVRYYDSWVEVSPDQSLIRTTSTDSETDDSESRKEYTNHSTDVSLEKNDTLLINKNVPIGLIDQDMTDSNNSSNGSEHLTDNKPLDTQKENFCSSDNFEEKDFIENSSKVDEIVLNLAASDYKNKSNRLKTLKDPVPNLLPRLSMLQTSFEEKSETLSPTEGEQTDSKADDLDGNIIFDEDAPLDGQNDADIREESQKEDDEFCAEPVVHTSSQYDDELVQFLKEISDSISSKHPHTESVPDRGENEDDDENKGPRVLDLYIKMEFCDRTLRKDIDSGILADDDSKSWNYFRQIVKGLEYIHSKGIIHRDLNPRNIFITNEEVIKIGDFGLSRLHTGGEENSNIFAVSRSVIHIDSNVAKSSEITGGVGTVWYTAPEALSESSCSYGHEVDLFSLGLIFFEMCHVPITTDQEKAFIFKKLRNDRIFPDTFDRVSKEKQAKTIESLLDPDPKARVPLTKLKSPAEGFVESEPLEKRHFKEILPEVISRPNEELYQTMLKQLFSQRTGKCWSSLESKDIPKSVVCMTQSFISIAESHGAKNINLPLVLPSKGLVSPDIDKPWKQAMFLDPQGNPVILSDSSLKAFIFQLERNIIPLSRTIYYNTQSTYRLDPRSGTPIIRPQISLFALTEKDDMFAHAKALLTLQVSLVNSGQKVSDFTLCLTHKDLETGLAQMYGISETEQTVLYKLHELVGDTSQRLKFLKHIKPIIKIDIPEVLVTKMTLRKMAELIENLSGRLHRSVHGFNEKSLKSVREALDSIKNLKEILDQIGVCIDLKIELFMTNPQVGLADSGIKFRLRSKPKSYVIVRGGKYEIEADTATEYGVRDLFWYDMDPFQLKEIDITLERPDVIILYDKTCFLDVKSVAYLFGKMTSIGISVTEVERKNGDENQIHISPYCKFLVCFENQGAVVKYEEKSKLQTIRMKIQTVINHVKQRKNIPYREFLLDEV